MATPILAESPTPRKQYNPGTPLFAVKNPDGTFTVPSWRNDTDSYTVNLEAGTCDCPHYRERLAGTGQDCKHLKQVRAERWERLIAKANTLPAEQLPVLLAKHEENGNLEIALAIRCAMADRIQQVAA
jgi:hypothetical protein